MPAPATGTTADLEVDVGGSTRQYDLFVPSGYDADVPTALVLNFHGLMGSPAGQADFSQFNVTAETRGLLVAYPRGIGQSFNAGACCGDAASQGVDDVGFARALVAQVAAQHCVDPRRIYVTGMSNGGHMAHTLACEAADVFAAAAPVSGVLGIPCRPARPISVLDFHGTGDLIVPYGGAGPGFPPVDTMMADWAARNGCGSPSEVTVSVGDAVCERWPACTDGVEVTLCTLGAGHCWPGGGTCLFGTKSDAISASEMMADLFASQLLP
jgi:polyhydroxybutyrate depolymerase